MESAVIGLGFGDEGKGNFVNYLANKCHNPLVTRFSGGQQAGHTVVHNGLRHVFSSFGSGTLSGAPTYWSKFCSIDPGKLLNEMEVLNDKDIEPMLFIDNKCPITTPFDIISNREEDKINKHGSCGAGFGATINREENYYSLTFRDLFYPHILKEKLRLIKDCYYRFKNPYDYREIIDSFLEACQYLIKDKCIKAVDGMPEGYNNIFEGSQGLMLDQNIGFFPHVTRSNTGTKNVREITPEELRVYLVTRAYQTRHGNGYMSNKDIPNNIQIDPEETNRTNPFQGKFRRTLLDLSMLEYAMKKDDWIRECSIKSLTITCMDHIQDEYRFTYNDKIYTCDDESDFIAKVAGTLGINMVYTSRSPESTEIEEKSFMAWKNIKEIN